MSKSYSTVQYITVQYSTVQYITVQYITVQYSTVQYSTVQYSIVQYSTYCRYEAALLVCEMMTIPVTIGKRISSGTLYEKSVVNTVLCQSVVLKRMCC